MGDHAVRAVAHDAEVAVPKLLIKAVTPLSPPHAHPAEFGPLYRAVGPWPVPVAGCMIVW